MQIKENLNYTNTNRGLDSGRNILTTTAMSKSGGNTLRESHASFEKTMFPLTTRVAFSKVIDEASTASNR